jgi:hypothetical protein
MTEVERMERLIKASRKFSDIPAADGIGGSFAITVLSHGLISGKFGKGTWTGSSLTQILEQAEAELRSDAANRVKYCRTDLDEAMAAARAVEEAFA